MQNNGDFLITWGTQKNLTDIYLHYSMKLIWLLNNLVAFDDLVVDIFWQFSRLSEHKACISLLWLFDSTSGWLKNHSGSPGGGGGGGGGREAKSSFSFTGDFSVVSSFSELPSSSFKTGAVSSKTDVCSAFTSWVMAFCSSFSSLLSLSGKKMDWRARSWWEICWEKWKLLYLRVGGRLVR